MVGRACAIVILVLVFTSIASAAQLKMEPGAATEHDYRKALLDFNRRTLIDAYKTIGRKDPKWDEPAVQLRVRYRDLKIRKLTAKPTDAATQPVAAK